MAIEPPPPLPPTGPHPLPNHYPCYISREPSGSKGNILFLPFQTGASLSPSWIGLIQDRALPGTALVLWCAGIAPVRTPHVRTVVCVAVFLVSFSLHILSKFFIIFLGSFYSCIHPHLECTVQKTSLYTLSAVGREYWVIYRGPGFLAVLWFGSSPTPFPLSFRSASCLSFSVFLCVADQACWRPTGERGRGWARSRIIRPQESLVFYKSFNTLCQQRWERSSVKCTCIPRKSSPLKIIQYSLDVGQRRVPHKVQSQLKFEHPVWTYLITPHLHFTIIYIDRLF